MSIVIKMEEGIKVKTEKGRYLIKKMCPKKEWCLTEEKRKEAPVVLLKIWKMEDWTKEKPGIADEIIGKDPIPIGVGGFAMADSIKFKDGNFTALMGKVIQVKEKILQ